ncbi:pentatricopeptide repeat-containing protein At5g64320, mitochondrial-like isoform X1 [Daucus carota subsp. sativus]|uniref:pentatricopeptide repeat-containing protein At5g64320, mitochondrial-like isoform X1 n=1 Tax=Daucus carota subsp. sativus TaxID=79200 RepID=UPI0030828126
MGYTHTFNVYCTLINKPGAAGEFKLIDGLLLRMKDEGVFIQESLFISKMRHYGRAGLPGQSTRLLFDMRDVFSCEYSFRSYNVVLDILVAGDCSAVAPNIFYEMLHKGISPTVFTFGVVMMKALCMVNEVDSACSLLRDMTKHGCVPNSVIYQTLIHALCKVNRINDVIRYLEEMFLMGCTPDVDTFNDVIHGLCRAKRIPEGAKLVDRMLLGGFTPSKFTYGILMDGLCRTGQVDKARALLDRVPEPNVVLFNTLINGHVVNGQFDDANAVLRQRMPAVGCNPDIYTYNIIIRGLCSRKSFS